MGDTETMDMAMETVDTVTKTMNMSMETVDTIMMVDMAPLLADMAMAKMDTERSRIFRLFRPNLRSSRSFRGLLIRTLVRFKRLRRIRIIISTKLLISNEIL